jgi:hypothetical protein
MNFLDHLPPSNDTGLLKSDLFPYPIRLAGQLPAGAQVEKKLVLGVRPEHVGLRPEPDPESVPCVVVRKFLGVAGQYLVAVHLREHTVWVKCTNQLGRALVRQAYLRCRPEAVTVFDEGERALPVRLVRGPETTSARVG